MKYLEVRGGRPLSGTVRIQGSKNAVLPILTACLLGDGGCVIQNCPVIRDVKDHLSIMCSLGCEVHRTGNTVTVNAEKMKKYEIKREEAARIRSSVLFLGALLGKMGKVLIPRPGGCAIGARPIDLHLYALESLGAQTFIQSEISTEDADVYSYSGQWVQMKTEHLRGTEIKFSFPSVGATENAILAAVMADGETIIYNAAQEPEIDEVCTFLNLRGAQIRRLKNGSIRIRGVRQLKPITYQMKADRIVAGTYLLAAAATGGQIRIPDYPWSENKALLSALAQMGVHYTEEHGEIELLEGGIREQIPYLPTAPYPGFPTDLQSPFMAAVCRVQGTCTIHERLFENRFATAAELKKMGADITVEGYRAVISGVHTLHTAVLCAPDLRGGAALVIGALQAEGCTQIRNAEYIDRGYEDICRDLKYLGADIRSVSRLTCES